MPADPAPPLSNYRVTRAALSNGSRNILFGDGRSVGARRIRDLVEAFSEEVGGFSNLPASGQQVVRRLAQISVELEVQEAVRASGQAIDPVLFVSLVNSQRRLLKQLHSIKPKPVRPLDEHLARRYGGGAK